MKILFATKAMGNPAGGAERVLATVASGLSRQGHHVFLLSFDQEKSSSYFSLDQKISFIKMGIGSVSRPTNPLETVRRIFQLRTIVKKLAPDVVIGFNPSMFIPLWFALIGLRIPMISSEHSSYEHYRRNSLQALLFGLAPFFTKKITVLSELVLRTFPRSVQPLMVVMNNPVALTQEGRANVEGSRGGRKLLLAVGRLSVEKDHSTLIEAFALLAPRLPEWDLKIVGDGAMRSELESKIVEKGLVSRVFLPGNNKDISREYLNAQLFVIPSKYEGFGLVVAEALAHGLPVVGFKECDGIARLIDHGVNGILVGTGKSRALMLSDALYGLMENPTARKELSRKCTMPKGFGIDEVVGKWEEFIKTAVAG